MSKLHLTLIDGPNQLLYPLYQALNSQGYTAHLLADAAAALPHLPHTDLLILDTSVASQPKSSQLIHAPAILVLTATPGASLPPWLRAKHVHQMPHPATPAYLIERLEQYIIPRQPDLHLDQSSHEHLPLLFGITQTLSGQLDIHTLFERILSLAPHLGGEFASLLIQEGDETIYFRSTQPGRQELTGAAGRRLAHHLLSRGLEGWVLRHQQTILISNTKLDSRWLKASYLPDHAHCVIAVPILLERIQARGVYMVGHTRPGHFRPPDIPLIENATVQISRAIENGLLFKNQAERSVQLALINEVSQTATSILNLEAMLKTVVQAINRSFAFYRVTIYLYQPDTEQVELQARATLGQQRSAAAPPEVRHRLREGLVGWCAATSKTILVNDVTKDPRYKFTADNDAVRSELCVPITLGNKIIGVLNLQSTQPEAFDKYHVSAMETLVDQLAVAIENARLYDDLNRRMRELKTLMDIGHVITSSLELKQALTFITDHTITLMDAEAASVVLRQGELVKFAAASGTGSEEVMGLRLELGQGLAGWVAAHGEPVIVPDVNQDTRFFAEFDQASGFSTRSILCVPLITKGQIIGAIEVVNKKRGTFTGADQSLLEGLAVSAATAIENARLYEDKVRTIHRLAETQRQLVQSAKLAAVGELAAGVAHEINNPLTTIINCTGLLLDTSVSTPLTEQQEDLSMIFNEARRARDIVRNLLDFARADAPQRQPANLNEIIEAAVFLVYTKSVSYKVQLNKELDPLPELYLDQNQIKQVLVNLLNNAIQAMADNKIRPALLTIRSRYLDEYPHPYQQQTAPTVICQIADTGHGILPEHLDKVFDPFFTTKEVGEGTGLGLSISYGIMEQHGGYIDVDSTPGQGTTFTLVLPLLEAVPSPPDMPVLTVS